MLLFKSMKNELARHILVRIHAVRLAKTRGLTQYAATLIEAHEWATRKFDTFSCGYCHRCRDNKEKEYQVLYKFWIKMQKLLDHNELRRTVIRSPNGRYAIVNPQSCMPEVYRKWQ